MTFTERYGVPPAFYGHLLGLTWAQWPDVARPETAFRLCYDYLALYAAACCNDDS